jgi:hypothetical protein
MSMGVQRTGDNTYAKITGNVRLHAKLATLVHGTEKILCRFDTLVFFNLLTKYKIYTFVF